MVFMYAAMPTALRGFPRAKTIGDECGKSDRGRGRGWLGLLNRTLDGGSRRDTARSLLTPVPAVTLPRSARRTMKSAREWSSGCSERESVSTKLTTTVRNPGASRSKRPDRAAAADEARSLCEIARRRAPPGDAPVAALREMLSAMVQSHICWLRNEASNARGVRPGMPDRRVARASRRRSRSSRSKPRVRGP